MLKERIYQLRKKKNITQQQLAEAIGADRTTIVHWEKGTREPSREMVEAISSFFEVSTDYLLGKLTDEEQNLLDDLKTLNMKKLLEGNYCVSWDGEELDEEERKHFLMYVSTMMEMKKKRSK